MQHFLSPKELAEAIDVSESSLKRWADDGVISFTRTAGGHRRIALREALRFIRKMGVPIVKPEILGIADLQQVSARRAPAHPADADQQLIAALKEGRASEVRGLFLSAYLSGSDLAELFDGPIASAMHVVGELCRHGPEGIVVEHRAVDICMQALHHVQSLLPTPAENAPLALGGTPEDDPYILPSLMISVVLGAAGWKTMNLGADVPSSALLFAAKASKPALVGLSCSVDEIAQKRDREIRKMSEALVAGGSRVILGGRAWESRRPDLPAGVSFATSMGAMAAFAEGLTSATAV